MGKLDEPATYGRLDDSLLIKRKRPPIFNISKDGFIFPSPDKGQNKRTKRIKPE